MRTKYILEFLAQETEQTVAMFGGARLVRTRRDTLEVHGGSETDQEAAWNWVNRFLTPPVPLPAAALPVGLGPVA